MIFNTVGIISFAITIIFVRSTFLESVEAGFKKREEVVLRGFKRRGLKLKRTFSRLPTFSNRSESKKETKWGKITGGAEDSFQVDDAEFKYKVDLSEDQDGKEKERANGGAELESDDDESDYESDIIALKKERMKEIRSQVCSSSVAPLVTTKWMSLTDAGAESRWSSQAYLSSLCLQSEQRFFPGSRDGPTSNLSTSPLQL